MKKVLVALSLNEMMAVKGGMEKFTQLVVVLLGSDVTPTGDAIVQYSGTEIDIEGK